MSVVRPPIMNRPSLSLLLLIALSVPFGCKKAEVPAAPTGPIVNNSTPGPQTGSGVEEVPAPKEYKGVPVYDGATMPKSFQGMTMNNADGKGGSASAAEFFTSDPSSKVADWYKEHMNAAEIKINNPGLAMVEGKASDGSLVHVQIMEGQDKGKKVTVITIVASSQ